MGYETRLEFDDDYCYGTINWLWFSDRQNNINTIKKNFIIKIKSKNKMNETALEYDDNDGSAVNNCFASSDKHSTKGDLMSPIEIAD